MMKKILTILVVLGLASVASAGLTCYSQNFEGMNQADPAALSNDGWLVFGNVFGLDWNYWYVYGPFPARMAAAAFVLWRLARAVRARVPSSWWYIATTATHSIPSPGSRPTCSTSR